LGWIDSRTTLVETYRSGDHTAIGNLPMIYNGFVHRDVINAVMDRHGGYFVPAHLSPDVGSGIINLAYTSQFLYSRRPLAVRGNSKRSNGTSFWARSLGQEQQAIYFKEQRTTLEKLTHPSMTVSQDVGFANASLKLFLKDLLFPHDNELQIDRSAVVKSTLAALNNDPEAYDDTLSEALQLADKIGFLVDPKTIPAKTTAAATQFRRPLQGLFGTGPSLGIGINCNLANIFDVAGAARLAESMISPMNVTISHTAVVAKPERKAS
jgi:hypothetical protein